MQRGFVLHSDCQAFFAGYAVLALPLAPFLASYEHWTEQEQTNYDLRVMMRWINIAHC